MKKLPEEKKKMTSFITEMTSKLLKSLNMSKNVSNFTSLEDEYYGYLSTYYANHPSFAQARNIINEIVSVYRYEFLINTVQHIKEQIVIKVIEMRKLDNKKNSLIDIKLLLAGYINILTIKDYMDMGLEDQEIKFILIS